jgi:hypothetical protein
MGLGSLFGIGGGAAAGTSAFTSVSAVNNAVATAAVNEVRRGIDSVVRNRAYSFNPYRTYLDFERALLIGPVGFGIDSLTGHHIADAQQTRVAGYVRSSYLVTATAVAAMFCMGCTLQSIGPILQGAYMGAAVGTSSGVAQAALTGGDPSQAAVMGFLIGGASGALGGHVSGFISSKIGAGLTSYLGEAVGNGVKATLSNIGGSVVGSSFGGTLSAAAGETNIGKGAGLGALSGVLGGAMTSGLTVGIGQLPPNLASALSVAEAGHFGDAAQRFFYGGVDWTSGWLGTQIQGN